jgi:AcrR family transcriptional regulator
MSKKEKSGEITKESAALGRKRDHTLDARIIEAAIDILAEVGFDSMTMDMVAARAKSGKATVYRRWSSKAELVRDALIWMSRSSVELENLPETGALRSDLLALLKPYSTEHGERKFRVLAGLGSFFPEHQDLAEESIAGIFEPWTEVNRALMQRAVERGEISPRADIEMACEVIISMTYYYSLGQNKPFDKAAFSALLDNVLLPALKNPPSEGK